MVIDVTGSVEGIYAFLYWKKSAKKTAIFGQKTPILALFDPFFKENFRRFSVKGGGGVIPPLSAKVFLAK